MRSRPRVLNLHIGLGKTGTSALQTFFASERAQLQELGFIYPALVDLAPASRGEPTRGNGLPLAQAIGWPGGVKKDAERPDIGEMADLLLEHATGTSDIIVSSEALQFFEPERLSRFCDLLAAHDIQTRVICFVRSCREFYLSVWKQHIKTFGNDVGFSEILETFGGLQQTVVKNLEQVGSRHVAFDVFNYNQGRNDIVGFFLRDVLNVQGTSTPRIVNPSIDLPSQSEQSVATTTDEIESLLCRFQPVFEREAEVVNAHVIGEPIEL